MADALSGVFRQPFAEQVAAFRLRLGDLVPTAVWDELTGAQHDRAFMVAGATKADLLADLARAVDKAISEGTGFDAFQKDFRALVEKNGWHGWTGEGTAKGEAWRMRTIYRTNMATTYAAGRLAQLRDGKFAFWVYKHGGSLEPRLQHLAWNGVALPPDHPFWREHYPPNGWNCSCTATGARTEAGIKRVGGDPAKGLPPGWEAIDPKTGTPVGVGKGWDHAPGDTVSDIIQAIRPKLETLPPQPSIDLIQSMVRSHVFEAWTQNPVGNLPLVRISAADAQLIGSDQKVGVLSPESWAKQQAKHPDLVPADYARAQDVVSHPTNRVTQGDTHLLFIQEDPAAGGYVLVVKAVAEKGELFIVSFRRMSRDQARRDQDVANLLRKGG